MHASLRLSTGLSLFWIAAARLPAQCVYNLNTGWDNAAGAAVAVGVNDDQYTVVDDQGNPAGPAITGGPGVFPIPPWVANTDKSLWVSSEASSVDLPAVYTYEIKFNLEPSPDLGDYILLGRWATDDTGLDILINGAATGQTAGGFTSYTEIRAGTGKGLFVAGANTVRFSVQNGGADPNPTGLRVDACVGLPPPEVRELDISTGFDEVNLVTLPDLTPDPGWTITGPAGSGIGPVPALVLNHAAFPIPPWLPKTVQSKWVGTQNPGSDGPGGLYSYATKVTIADRFDGEVSELKGKFSVDDAVRDLKVNGTSTGVTGAGFTSYTQIPPGTGKGLFRRGENTIEFIVENGGQNPTGLRVDAEVTVGKRPPPSPECIYRISTGWDNGAGRIVDPLGDPDDEYTVDDGMGAGPQPALTFPGDRFPVPPWLLNNDTSVWIAPTPDTNAAAGTYFYEIAVNLPEDLDLRKLAIIGRWATDDPGQDVIVNDTPTGIAAGGFLTWTVFPPGAGNGLFVPGPNSIKFQVLNGGGPTGVRVDGCVGLQTAENRDFDLSTGFDEETLVVLPNGAQDPGYLVSGPGFDARPAVVIRDDAFPLAPAGPWVASNVQSKWIGVNASSDGAPGTYIYRTTAKLDAGLDAGLTSIVGDFAADETLIDIYVNGEPAGSSGAGLGSEKLNPLPVGVGRGLFRVGDNTIEFIVENGGGTNSPTGFRLDGQLSVCPLPPGGALKLKPGTFTIDTGFSEELGALIENGQPDDNYELIGPAGTGVCRIEAKVVFDNQFPIGPWFPTTPQSKWVGTGEAASGGPPGNYTFRIKVNLPDDFDVENARLIGSWSTDNNAPDIMINGTSTGITGGGNFTVLSPFPDGAGQGLFRRGENVIDFIVFNAPPGVNPAGLRVEGVVGTGQADPRDLSTGISNRGIGPLGAGQEDDSYSVSGPGAGPAKRSVVVKTLGAGWVANSGTSRWIGLDGSDSRGPAGAYTYEVPFTAPTDTSPLRLAIAGKWAAATSGVDVVLNGTSLKLASPGPNALTDFPAGTGKGLIWSGLNTLQFIVQNAAAGPTGLRVDARLQTIVEANPLDISTGFDQAAGAAISDADPGDLQPDDDYTVTDPTDFMDQALVIGPGAAPIPPWVPSTESSRWIGPVGAIGAPPGQYRYRIEVTLTRDQAPYAYLAGVWATDDHGDDILINDQPTGIQNNGGFAGYTPLPPDAGLGLFVEGTNVIEFQVTNGGAAGNPHGLRVDALVALKPLLGPRFRRGDVDGSGTVDITDAINNLGFQFLGSFVPTCRDALDDNDDGKIDLTDAVFSLNAQFLGTPLQPDPGPVNCGPDPTGEAPELGCEKPCP